MIVDFGLAHVQTDGGITLSGDLLGTLRYMSPEQAGGRRDVDHRTDVYSLGATIYEIATLRPAFPESDRTRLLRRILTQEPIPPRRIDPHVPRDLETIIGKAMEKDRGRRYGAAAELGQDLQAFLGGQPIRARRVGVLGRAWRWSGRNRAVSVLAAVAAVFFLIAGASLVVMNTLRRERDFAVRERERAERAELETSLWFELAESRADRRSGATGQVFESLKHLEDAAGILRRLDLDPDTRHSRILDLRSEVIACAARVDLELYTVATLPSFPAELAFDAALERYAWGDRRGRVTVCRVEDGGALHTLVGPDLRVSFLCFSPDGRFLAANFHMDAVGHFKLWDLHSGEVVVDGPRAIAYWSLDFSPSGEQFALGSLGGDLDLHDPVTGQRLRSIPMPAGSRSYMIRYHPEGTTLAVSFSSPSALRREVLIHDLTRDALSRRLLHPHEVRGIAFHPAGRILAAACADQSIHVWRLDEDAAPLVLTGHRAEVIGVTFSHSGRLLASTSWDATLRLWDPRRGRLLTSTVLHNPTRHQERFSNDDRLLAYNLRENRGREVCFWRVAPGRACQTLRSRQNGKGPFTLSIGPAGRVLVSTQDGGLTIWDLEAGVDAGSRRSLPMGEYGRTFFRPARRELLTVSGQGVSLWPVERREDGGGIRLRIGPPRTVVPSFSVPTGRSDLSDDGRTLVYVQGGTIRLVDLETGALAELPGAGRWFRAHDVSPFVDVSPGGRWVAVGTWDRYRVKVCDAASGGLVAELGPEDRHRVRFSPDGRWLVSSSSREYRFYRVPSWEPDHTVRLEKTVEWPGPMAFTKNGALLVLTSSPHQIRLVEPSTGRELATLEAPAPDDLPLIQWLTFSPDGTRLAAASAGTIHVWDLRTVRAELAKLGLDWDSPPYPPLDRSGRPPPLLVEFVEGP